MVNDAVNGWFTGMVKDAINPVFALVGRTLLSSPPPSMLARIQELTGQVAVVANALLVLFVLAAGLILMAHGSVQSSTTVKQIAPRLVVATILLNGSLMVCEQAIQFANALVVGLLEGGVDPQRAANLLSGKIVGQFADPISTVTYLIVLAAVAVVLGIVLAFIAVIRVILLLFLVISAPLALLCHALPQTEGIAKMWWRAMAGVLAIQVLQALVLMLGFKVLLTHPSTVFGAPHGPARMAAVSVPSPVDQAVDVVILISLMYILVKIPVWVARSIWQQAKPQTLVRLAKAVVVYKTLGAAGAAFRGTKRLATGKPQDRAPRSGPGNAGRPAGGMGPGPRPGPGGPRSAPSGGRPGPIARPGARQGPGGGPRRSVTPTVGTPVRANRPGRYGRAGMPALASPSPYGLHGGRRPGQPGQQLKPGLPAGDRSVQGTQLALPFPVRSVSGAAAPSPRYPAARPGVWGWSQAQQQQPVRDRLPGTPPRPMRPQPLQLRLDPPRRNPKRGRR